MIPPNEQLMHVADAFGVCYEWLLTGKGSMEAEEAVMDEKLIEWLNEQT